MENLFDVSIAAGAVAAMVIGLTQVIKSTFSISKRFVPMVSVLLGITICVPAFYLTGNNPWFGIFGGIIAGLSACGLWSGAKATSGR